jgi:hypothetical protein
MFRPIKEFFSSLSEAQQAVTTIVAVVVVVMSGWATALQWLNDLNTWSKVFYSIALCGLIFIFAIAFVTWWRKHDVDNIPGYLCQLDNMMRDYVNTLNTDTLPPEDMAATSVDLGELWHINVNEMESALKNKDKVRMRKLGYTASNQFAKLIDPKDRSNSTMKSLLTTSGIMNYHGVGLDRVTNTANYQKIFTKVKRLQQVVPNAETNIHINQYLNWSEGLYSVLLSYRCIMDKPEILALLPASERASTSYIARQIEGNTATLISAVRESLDKGKTKGQKP